jgi:hypothetical protein
MGCNDLTVIHASAIRLENVSVRQSVVPLVPLPLRYLCRAEEIKERAQFRLMDCPGVDRILRHCAN